MTVARYVPTVPATQIEFRCWCGYRGTLANQPAHRAEHKRKGEK